MGPTRTTKATAHAQSSSSGKLRKTSNSGVSSSKYGGTLSVQKLKASLRQTRRLLAKNKLAADFRVETERRLKSLEADLAKAELARKEKTNAIRYHKVKFFERQKVLRKLNQAKKQLSVTTKAEERKALEVKLTELRIDLNYIIHYPKTKKYISLFPPEIRKGEASPSTSSSTVTDTEREKVRSWIKQQMEVGDLSQEPESSHAAEQTSRSSRGIAEAWIDAKSAAKKPLHHSKSGADDFIEDDAFFGEEEAEDDEMSDENTE